LQQEDSSANPYSETEYDVGTLTCIVQGTA
jgi:hypothetical protein